VTRLSQMAVSFRVDRGSRLANQATLRGDRRFISVGSQLISHGSQLVPLESESDPLPSSGVLSRTSLD
jgi:hypothetical protein